MKRALIVIVSLMSATAGGQSGTIEVSSGAAGWDPQMDEYVVERGDTLWDISQRVVGNPFLWPKVWSLNPEIENPHWIYPGDIIRFYEPDQGLPTRAELVAGTMDVPEDSGIEEAPDERAGPDIEVVSTDPAAGRERGLPARRFVGKYVTPEELAESGRLTNARPDKMLLDVGDHIYFTSDKRTSFKRGQIVMTYAVLGRVRHPVQGVAWGYMTRVTGLARVEGITDTAVYARLIVVDSEVERGQYITPMNVDPRQRITKVKTNKRIDGFVIAVRNTIGHMAGSQELVFIDRGKKDGIETGNQLLVMDRGDPVTGEEEATGYQGIGLLQVVEAKSNAATCLVLKSLKEIEPGHKVRTVTR